MAWVICLSWFWNEDRPFVERTFIIWFILSSTNLYELNYTFQKITALSLIAQEYFFFSLDNVISFSFPINGFPYFLSLAVDCKIVGKYYIYISRLINITIHWARNAMKYRIGISAILNTLIIKLLERMRV